MEMKTTKNCVPLITIMIGDLTSLLQHFGPITLQENSISAYLQYKPV